MGFAAILDPRYSALVSTTKVPSLLFQRMSKEEVKIADGPMRLLETMDLDISFRKILTRKLFRFDVLWLGWPFDFIISFCLGGFIIWEFICFKYYNKGLIVRYSK